MSNFLFVFFSQRRVSSNFCYTRTLQYLWKQKNWKNNNNKKNCKVFIKEISVYSRTTNLKDSIMIYKLGCKDTTNFLDRLYKKMNVAHLTSFTISFCLVSIIHNYIIKILLLLNLWPLEEKHTASPRVKSKKKKISYETNCVFASVQKYSYSMKYDFSIWGNVGTGLIIFMF